jgi:hypothetical protein
LYPGQPGDSADRPDQLEVDRLLVTSVGHWRGEAIALMTTVDA